MLEIFQYSFMVRALLAGVVIAILCPLIGIFLVLRRYSLMADTLAHVSLAGVALGFLTNLNPLLTALGVTVISSIFIEKLRSTKRIFGESALALFLSASLAIAIILIGLARGITVDLLSYLFGSILTTTSADLYVIVAVGSIVIGVILLLFKELVFISFDEEAAQVSGIPTKFMNLVLIALAAVTIAISMRIVGILLISALIVIPVVTALQMRSSFAKTTLIAEGVALFSVILGIIASFYLNLPTGATVVLVSLACFLLTLLLKRT